MNPQALLHAIATHDWMPVLLFASLVVRTWLTDKSKFPLSLPVNWQPVVVAAATAFCNAVAGAQAGESLQVITMTTLAWAGTTGFLDGVLVAVWGDPKKAPVWGRWIVMTFDSVERSSRSGTPSGGGGSGTPFRVPAPMPTPVVTPTPSPPPAAALQCAVSQIAVATGGVIGIIAAGVAGIGFIQACTPAATGLPAASDIAQYWADQNGCVEDAGTREAADACRKTNRLAFCAKFPASENCVVADAGAHE